MPSRVVNFVLLHFNQRESQTQKNVVQTDRHRLREVTVDKRTAILMDPGLQILKGQGQRKQTWKKPYPDSAFTTASFPAALKFQHYTCKYSLGHSAIKASKETFS